MRKRLLVLFQAAWLLCLLSVSFAQEQYYQGKTITFIVGAAPGGGFDTYTRLLGRHIGKHIPGIRRLSFKT